MNEVSHILHRENGFEVAVDESTNEIMMKTSYRVSVGTGFTSANQPSVNMEIPVTLDQLKEIHQRLGELITEKGIGDG